MSTSEIFGYSETLPQKELFPTLPCKRSTNETMKAVEWMGNSSIRVVSVPKVVITDPKDVIVKITGTTICGSDLHLYHNMFPGKVMEKHDILGHEAVGIVESVGHEVMKFQPGDRVVISFAIACGFCSYCQKEEFSLCENTNQSREEFEIYGSRTSGIFGYSKLMGHYEGLQAEYARVPYGDRNLLKISVKLPDEVAVLLSDVVNTGWHGNALANVQKGDVVAIWGAGPIGCATAVWAAFRGADQIIVIDKEDYRLNLIKKNVSNVSTINFTKEKDVFKAVRSIKPEGPSVCIECAGFRYPKGFSHTLEHKLGLETDDSCIITEMFHVAKKRARIILLGDYVGYCNQFPIGMLHAKSLLVTGGQTFVQQYWETLLRYMEREDVDFSWMITHKFTLDEAVKAYNKFDSHQDDVLKVFLKTNTNKVQQFQEI